MTIIPNQPFGLGDIIFTQTLVRRIANGNPIVWPVFPQFVDQLNRAYPDIRFVDWRTTANIDYNRKEQYVINEGTSKACTILPIRFASEILGGNYPTWMSDKYKLYGMDYNDWRDCAMWERDADKEDFIYFQSECNNGIPYSFKNTMFGSDCSFKTPIVTDNLDSVCLQVLNGVSLFDWAKIIQNASAIHTVNTSIIYLLEMLDLKAPEVHLYQRSIPGQTFAGIDYLLKKHKYIFHA